MTEATATPSPPDHDVIIIGGGQAGLSAAYYLRRTDLEFIIFDANDQPGGAWRHGWDSLRLFSPALYSSLPGWPMPDSPSGQFPSRDEAIDYLTRYEERYDIPVKRPVRVRSVERAGPYLVVKTEDGSTTTARAVISATGTWEAPYIPEFDGLSEFGGTQLHSAFYKTPDDFAGQRVLIVGGGNSGAQIQAELSLVADTSWVTTRPPRFLPDDVDGHVLFQQASQKIKAGTQTDKGIGDIVMIPPVKAARDEGRLETVRLFERFTQDGVIWRDGTREAIDAVIWCTGFRPATGHLAGLGIVDADGKVAVRDLQAIDEPRLWLTGYGNWTGPASATLIGSGRVARHFVPRLAEQLSS